jgi:hypothetical protein
MKMLPRPKEPGPAGPTVKPATQGKLKGLRNANADDAQARERYEAMKRTNKHREEG